MEDQKTVVVEKRLSRGVIRRRSRNEDAVAPKAEAPEKVAAVETNPAPKPELLQVESRVVARTAVVDVAKSEQINATEDKQVKRTLTLDEVNRKRAEEVLVQNLAKARTKTPKPQKEEPAVEVKAPVKENYGQGVEKIIIQNKSGGALREKPVTEEKPVLSFKDRVRGTIDLNQFKTPDQKRREQNLQNRPAVDDLGFVIRPAVTDAAEEENAEIKKRARSRRGVKVIGGDLDIEGMGRESNLSQLTRTAPSDRVFRPGDMGARGRRKKVLTKKNVKSTAITTKKASKRVIQVDQGISVGNLAQQLGEKASVIIKKLMDLGTMVTINQVIDKDTATLIATEYQYEVRDTSFKEDEFIQSSAATDEELMDAPVRPPVVTIMGHVDHGKTSLLDAIKSTSVTETEAGGITQHIGAYTVELHDKQITFIDTPGHEAFTSMRSRGAKVTDIVVLVVAADDGMMPQTEESIDHARAAGVPIIVAINKIDKPEANVERIRRQLSEKGLLSEAWGGDVIFSEVSAKTKVGIPELLESILLQAEVLELKALPDVPAQGTVLESKLDRNKGPLSTLLIQTGKIKIGDYVVAGEFAGKARAMNDWKGQPLKEAGPSIAVEILGLEGVPDAGDVFNVVSNEQDARSVVEFRKEEKRKRISGNAGGMTLEDVFAKMKSGEVSELNIILKADVQGSLEAVKEAILKIGNAEVQAKIIHSAVGGINESDVVLAKASQAVVIGFNVRPETKAIHHAKDAKVEIKLYKIIYELVNEVKLALEGLLAPDISEDYLGRAEVRQTFEVSKLGTIAGCMVVDGTITRAASLRLLRDNVVVYEGKVSSLKRFKDDAKDVKEGFECGIGIEGYKDIKTGDVIEAFMIIETPKTL